MTCFGLFERRQDNFVRLCEINVETQAMDSL